MRISKSLLELAHKLASQPVNQHSPKGNVVVEAKANKEAAGHAWQAEQHKAAAAKLKSGSKAYHFAKAAYHSSMAEYHSANGNHDAADGHDDMHDEHIRKAHGVNEETMSDKREEDDLLEYEKYTDEHGVTWNDEGDSDKGHTKWGKGPMWHGPKKHYHSVPYKDKEHAKGEGMKWDKEKRSWYHTDAGKSATSKFRKLHEEESLEEGSVGHKFIVTTSDPNHPSVSMRKETKMNMIKVSEVDKEKAKKRATDFYKKKGLKVHDVEHHSELREGTGE